MFGFSCAALLRFFSSRHTAMLEQKRTIKHNSLRTVRIEESERTICSTVTVIAIAVITPIRTCIIGFISKKAGRRYNYFMLRHC